MTGLLLGKKKIIKFSHCAYFLWFDFLNLGADPQVRSWISFYIRNSQKRHNEALVAFRTKLLDQLKSLVKEAKVYEQRNGAISQHVVVRASAILRLYTALKGIAGLKYVDLIIFNDSICSIFKSH